MSNQTKQLTRRHFLKGAAYLSALSVGGLSSAAFAACGHKNTKLSSSTSSVTLYNRSDKTVVLDATQPVSLEKVNGWVVVKINKAPTYRSLDLKTDKVITLTAGQKLSFTVDSEMSPMLKEGDDYVVLTNEFAAFNNMVPIASYNELVA